MITPFLHKSLYNYKQFHSFQDLQVSGLLNLCLLNRPSFVEISCTPQTSTIHSTPTSGLLDDENKDVQTIPCMMELNLEESDRPRNSCRRFQPKKSDTLFWSIFVAQYGVKEFLDISQKYMNREIEEKTAIVEFMTKSKALLKSMKYTAATVQEIMGDLMTNRSTTLAMVGIMAIYYNRTIWIVCEKYHAYLEFLGRSNNNDSIPMIIYQSFRSSNTKKEYSCCEEVTDLSILENIKNTMWKLESWEKPLKRISSYKLIDLEKIITLLGLHAPEGVTKWKKNDMYHAIQVTLLDIFHGH